MKAEAISKTSDAWGAVNAAFADSPGLLQHIGRQMGMLSDDEIATMTNLHNFQVALAALDGKTVTVKMVMQIYQQIYGQSTLLGSVRPLCSWYQLAGGRKYYAPAVMVTGKYV